MNRQSPRSYSVVSPPPSRTTHTVSSGGPFTLRQVAVFATAGEDAQAAGELERYAEQT